MAASVFTSSRVLSISAALALLLTACGIAPQTTTPQQPSGAQLYKSLCASCHGTQGRGDGPVASLLVVAPPDITTLAERSSGFYPAIDVERTIDGRLERAAHGSRNMPVWGRQLYFSADPNDAQARAHADEEIRLLNEYVRSIQR